jgi:hypothetical protein
MYIVLFISSFFFNVNNLKMYMYSIFVFSHVTNCIIFYVNLKYYIYIFGVICKTQIRTLTLRVCTIHSTK